MFFTITSVFGQNTLLSSAYCGWYKVVESNNKEIWNEGGSFNLSEIKHEKQNASLEFLGFTNQGAMVIGYFVKAELIIPKQTAEIITKGGDGNQKWTIEIEAKGHINNDTLELSYLFKQEDFAESHGIIKALKVTDLIKCNALSKSVYKGNFNKVERTFKRQVRKHKRGIEYDNGPGSGMQISHINDIDSLIRWFKHQECVVDVTWDKCQEKIAIYPGWFVIGVKFKTNQGIKEKCFHIQQGTMGDVHLFAYRFHAFKARNILLYKKMYDYEGFIEQQRKQCLGL